MDSNPFSNSSILSALQDTLKLHSNRVGIAIHSIFVKFTDPSATFTGPFSLNISKTQVRSFILLNIQPIAGEGIWYRHC